MPFFVAPYVGAWIETIGMQTQYRFELSHPTWVRGLKHSESPQMEEDNKVAPYVGAWIETLSRKPIELIS